MSDPDPTIDWSYTNTRLYSACPRSLFYQFWRHQEGASETQPSVPTTDYVWRSSGGALVGSAVHEAINTQVERWATGRNTSRTEALGTARSYLRDHDTELQAETDGHSLIETAESHIDRFLSVIWPQIRTDQYILYETTRSFETAGTTVWVRPDLCHRDSAGRFVITDWKTRQPDPLEEAGLQLQVYALWAHMAFEPEVDRLKAQLAFTSTGDIRPQPVDSDTLEATRDRIRRDVSEWGDPNDQSQFPTEPRRENCRTCRSLPSCSAGKELVNESND